MSRIVALDYETSHLDPKQGAPVSIGVALMEDGKVLDSFHRIISPPMYGGKISRVYDLCALEISGVTWKQIKQGDPALKVLTDLKKWATEYDARHLTVVAFNAPFDLSFYSEMLFMAGNWNQHLRVFEAFVSPFLGPWQCARMLAMDALKLDKYSLDSVCDHYGFKREGDTHSAIDDAILAGKVYAELSRVQAGAK